MIINLKVEEYIYKNFLFLFFYIYLKIYRQTYQNNPLSIDPPSQAQNRSRVLQNKMQTGTENAQWHEPQGFN
jgi:hypothetical protein